MTSLPGGYNLVTLDRIDSTNEEAKRLAAAGDAGDAGNQGITVIHAFEQTAGRARRGRNWVSPPGNLYCSLLLVPECPIAEIPQYGFVAGIALRDALVGLLPRDCVVACKWPNDLLVNGSKVAGMLLEAAGTPHRSLDWLAIGVGLNINHHPEGTEFPATDLEKAGGKGIELETVLSRFIVEFESWRTRWLDDGFAPIREAWLATAHGQGAQITVRLDNSTYSGTFADLDVDGALLLDQGHTVRRIAAGDVYFAAA